MLCRIQGDFMKFQSSHYLRLANNQSQLIIM